ncbi:MAG TPA: hypothetical protein VEA59_02805 [Patescibacteria group bacterium]|nr:hypothetical protein [Patescibacteria group bacterium]
MQIFGSRNKDVEKVGANSEIYTPDSINKFFGFVGLGQAGAKMLVAQAQQLQSLLSGLLPITRISLEDFVFVAMDTHQETLQYVKIALNRLGVEPLLVRLSESGGTGGNDLISTRALRTADLERRVLDVIRSLPLNNIIFVGLGQGGTGRGSMVRVSNLVRFMQRQVFIFCTREALISKAHNGRNAQALGALKSSQIPYYEVSTEAPEEALRRSANNYSRVNARVTSFSTLHLLNFLLPRQLDRMDLAALFAPYLSERTITDAWGPRRSVEALVDSALRMARNGIRFAITPPTRAKDPTDLNKSAASIAGKALTLAVETLGGKDFTTGVIVTSVGIISELVQDTIIDTINAFVGRTDMQVRFVNLPGIQLDSARLIFTVIAGNSPLDSKLRPVVFPYPEQDTTFPWVADLEEAYATQASSFETHIPELATLEDMYSEDELSEPMPNFSLQM